MSSRSTGSGTPSIGAQASGMRAQLISIDDDDLDELADVPCSSPYFTQPTQIVNRATQPTQIIDRRTTLPHSSSPIPDTPASKTAVEIEVPASSPFQSQSQSQSHLHLQRPAIKTGRRLASLMAPAGTTFKSPINKLPQRPAIKQQDLISSDDDVAGDYKRQDSSDDELPMRGDIRPSSFAKKETSQASENKSDISLEDITDVRYRYLTKKAREHVRKAVGEIPITDCYQAVLQGGGSMEDIVDILLRKFGKGASVSNFRSGSASKPSSVHSGRSTHWKQSTLPRQFGFSSAKPDSSDPVSSPPAPAVAKPPPRRRLVHGHQKRSPTPEQVFSVSSSPSSNQTTPQSSAESLVQNGTKMAVTTRVSNPQPEEVKQRRRLVRGTRHQAPSRSQSSEVITIQSGSEAELPPLHAVLSRKRKAKAEPAVEPSGETVDILSDSDNGEDFANLVDSEDSGDDSQKPEATLFEEQDTVLQYLNSCTAEELARMTSLPLSDAKLVIDQSPFEDLTMVQKVSRKQKKGSTKSARTPIGVSLVEKLTQWFSAFKAAANVIKLCEERGTELESIMSTWQMDKNGKIKPSSPTPLPIADRPRLMDDSVQLKSYQLFGLNWLNLIHDRQYSGILADDMGLGKTCQVISFVSQLVETGRNRSKKCWPNLIVVPPSTLENWVNEFSKFAPDIQVFLYVGSDRKTLDPEDAANHHVVLTSYSQIERHKEDLEWLQELDLHAAIFDEGHKLKNRATLIYRNLSKIISEWRLVLSGTPVQNNLKELLSLLSFIEPSLFRDKDLARLQVMFETKVPSRDIHNFAALAKERVGNARTMIAPFILQRRKDDVLDLPRKTETRIVVGAHPVQRDIYNELKGSFLNGKTKSKAAKVSNPWMQLKKASIHHQLFRRHFTDDMVSKMTDILWKKCTAEELSIQSKERRHKEMFKNNLLSQSDFELHLLCKDDDFHRYIGRFDVPDRSWEDAPKVKMVLGLVREYIKNGDRCLIFSRFELVINILRETFYHAGIKYCELTGSVGVAERFPMIDKFNNNPKIPVFLLTTGAGGTGLNLTAANKIIIFDQSDNPQEDIQASNRVHRIGQKREVEVIKIITENTVEGLIYNSCVKKLMLAACVEGQYGDDEESIEEECRKQMMLDNEAELRASQL